MPRPLLILPDQFAWSRLVIQIQILNGKQCRSRSVQKPTDLDLHCLQRQGISGFSRTRVNEPFGLSWRNCSGKNSREKNGQSMWPYRNTEVDVCWELPANKIPSNVLALGHMELNNTQKHMYCDLLTHLCSASHKRDIGKQCRPRSDAAQRGVWSGSTLFALGSGITLKQSQHRHPAIGNKPVQRVIAEESTRHVVYTRNNGSFCFEHFSSLWDEFRKTHILDDQYRTDMII